MHNEGNKSVFTPHEGGEDAPSWIEIKSQREDNRRQNEQLGRVALKNETSAERLNGLKERAKRVLRPVAIAAAILVVSGATLHSCSGEHVDPTPKTEAEWSSIVERTVSEKSNLKLIYREDGGSGLDFDNGAIGEDFVHYYMTYDDNNSYIVEGKATKHGGKYATYEAEEGYGLDPDVVKQILDTDLESRME